MFIYIFIILILSFLGLSNKRYISNYDQNVLILLLSIFIGFRDEIGVDWFQYLEIFERFGYRSVDFILTTNEPLYFLINWFSANIGQDLILVNIICGLIFSIGLVKYCKEQPFSWIALLVSLPVLIIMCSLGYTRQSAAIGFWLIALTLLGKDYVAPSTFFIFISSLLHIPSLFLFSVPLSKLYTVIKKPKYYIPILIVTPIIYNLTKERFSTSFYGLLFNYSDMIGNYNGYLFRAILPVFASFVFLTNIGKFRRIETNKIINIYKLLSYMTIIFVVIGTIFNQYVVIVDRLGIYIYPIAIYVLTRIPIIKLYNISSFSWRVLIVITTSCYTMFWLIFAVHASYFVPYRNILF